MNSLFSRIYGGLASLKLTIVVLSVLAVALIYGTFYESANGTPMAHRYVYASKWFDAILLTLFVNMMACTAKRYPYKPHQLGFLMVHCGILTILTGAMLTRNFGRDGEVYVAEGESRDFMTSTTAFLRISVPQDGVSGMEVPVVFPAKAEGATVDRDLRLPHSSVRLHFSRFYPNARWRDTVGEGTTENPAVRVRWTQADTPGEAWLVPREAGRQSVDDPLHIEAAEARTAPEVDSLFARVEPPPASGRGELRLRQGGNPLATIPLAGEIPRRVQAGPYRIQLREWYSNFRIQDGRPVNASAAMANPALVFDVEGPRGAEHRVVFAFAEMQSLVPPVKSLGYDVDAEYAYAGAKAAAPRILLIHAPDRSWRIAASFGLDVPADRRVEIGRTYHSADGAFELTVAEALEHAESKSELFNVDRQEQNPAVLVAAADGTNTSESQWLVFGDTKTFQLGSRQVELEMTRRQMPLGFTVHLVDFVETTYPGTTRSATFASDVLVADSGHEPVPIHISMNKPLKHRGFRVFQSSYVRNAGQEASIFSVSYDPGVTVVYTGFIIFIAGLVVIFYLKPVIKRAYVRSVVLERT